MAISGALAAGIAVNQVLGAQGKLLLNFTGGAGFTGIAVALMGRNHPVGVLLAALLFGALAQGGSELAFEMPELPRETVVVVQGLVILFTGALGGLLRAPLARLLAPRAARGVEDGGAARPAGPGAVGDAARRDDAAAAALAGLFADARACGCWAGGQDARRAFAAAAVAAGDGSSLAGARRSGAAAVVLAAIPCLACVTLRGDHVVSGRASTFTQPSYRYAPASLCLVPAGRAISGPAAGAASRPAPAGRGAGGRHPGARPAADRRGGRAHGAGLHRLRPRPARRLPALAHALRAAAARGRGEPGGGGCGGRLGRAAALCRGADSGRALRRRGRRDLDRAGAGFTPEMTAGRGFIALAALILAHWRPWPALATCLLFGLLDAVAIRLQGVVVPGLGVPFPVQAVQALPYVLTVVLLAGFVGRAVAPRALGIPFVKER
jgi:simple sugar transport system permease protein